MALLECRATERIKVLKQHLSLSQSRTAIQRNGVQLSRPSHVRFCSTTAKEVRATLETRLTERGIEDVELQPPPEGLEEEYSTLLTPSAVRFVADLVRHFDKDVDLMLKERIKRKLELDSDPRLPRFHVSPEVADDSWKVAPVPRRLLSRQLDLGDVSPSNTEKFVEALQCKVNGIQTDFDDGHCPTWRAQLQGLHNVYKAVFGLFPGVPDITKVPILMLRPRAWNMIEHNMMVDGKEVPGPLFDFGLLMYHCGTHLTDKESGPFFYLSKLEGSREARLWNSIFCWAQDRLKIPHGTIKACVLIENVLASFEMETILYELRDHSLGLNCGIWDYSASFINKFGHREDFVLPDRNKYVNMQRHFLRSYMDLVIHICHKRGAHATGGMAANVLQNRDLKIITKITEAKFREILAGVDGFMVYDVKLVPIMWRMWGQGKAVNQLHKLRDDVRVTAEDLLEMPSGGVTLEGLKHNIAVGILFIASWLEGQGHFFYKGAVEDSATAEISRSQVWQWIRHRARLEDNGEVITRRMVQQLIQEVVQTVMESGDLISDSQQDRQRLQAAAEIFEEVVTKRDFPEFLTTYLNLDHTFLSYQKIYSN